MSDTAQAAPAETLLHEQFAQAANQLRERREAAKVPQRPRDENGRFAPQAQEDNEIPAEPDLQAEAEDQRSAPQEAEAEVDDEAIDEAEVPSDEDQIEAVPMPKSWNKDMEGTWAELPSDVQHKIAERENQRDMAVNSKFQELAETRKAFESQIAEANASRDKWAEDYDLLVRDLSLPKPTPQQFGYGTPQFDRAAYDVAMIEWEQGTEQLNGLKAQRKEIAQQQEKERLEAWNAQKREIEDTWRPKLLNEMPELADPQKAEPALQELVQFAISQGLSPDTFSEENQPYITSAQLRLLKLAKRAVDAEGAVKKAPPKKQPALRPGVATTRQAKNSVQRQQAWENLQSSGSIEDAVAVLRANRRK